MFGILRRQKQETIVCSVSSANWTWIVAMGEFLSKGVAAAVRGVLASTGAVQRSDPINVYRLLRC